MQYLISVFYGGVARSKIEMNRGGTRYKDCFTRVYIRESAILSPEEIYVPTVYLLTGGRI